MTTQPPEEHLLDDDVWLRRWTRVWRCGPLGAQLLCLLIARFASRFFSGSFWGKNPFMARFLRKNMQDLGRSTGPTGGQISCSGSAKLVLRPNQRISPSPPQSFSRHARILYIRDDWWFLQSLSVD